MQDIEINKILADTSIVTWNENFICFCIDMKRNDQRLVWKTTLVLRAIALGSQIDFGVHSF